MGSRMWWFASEIYGELNMIDIESNEASPEVWMPWKRWIRRSHIERRVTHLNIAKNDNLTMFLKFSSYPPFRNNTALYKSAILSLRQHNIKELEGKYLFCFCPHRSIYPRMPIRQFWYLMHTFKRMETFFIDAQKWWLDDRYNCWSYDDKVHEWIDSVMISFFVHLIFRKVITWYFLQYTPTSFFG